MAKWLERFEKAIGGGPGGPKRIKTMRVLLLMGGIGIFLMLLNAYLPFQDIETNTLPPDGQEQTKVEDVWGPSEAQQSSFESIERPLEMRLKEILEKMVGVGTVTVMVTVDSTEEKVLEHNERHSSSETNEKDANGGTREITSVTSDGQVVLYQASGSQQPIVVKIINPKIRGVLVVAEGAEDATVRKLIIQAIQKGFNVSESRISVVPSKQK